MTCYWCFIAEKVFLKALFTQNEKCHYLLTRTSFQTHKIIYFAESQKKKKKDSLKNVAFCLYNGNQWGAVLFWTQLTFTV